MGTIFTLNGERVSLDRDLVIGEGDDAITIPADSLKDAATREQWGIVETIVADEQREDDRFYWVHENGDGTFNNEPKSLAMLRPWAIAEVKRHRQFALDSFPKSSGVSEVYAENLRAAQAVQAGQGDAVMRDGSTATTYLGHMAVGMGVTVEQFVAYVVAENTLAAQKVREIEAEYVRLAYSYIPNCTFEQIKTVVQEFVQFCSERPAG